MSMPLSHFVPASPSPSPWQVHLLHLRLYSCPALRFFITIFFLFFRFHIYVLAYGICFSLSDLLPLSKIILRFIQFVVYISSSFYCWVIPYCVDITQLVYPVTCWWTLGCFQLGTITNKATVNIHIQVFLGTCVFIFFGDYLGVESLGHMVDVYFKLLRICPTFPKVVVPFYIPTSSIWEFWLLHILRNTGIVSLLILVILVDVWCYFFVFSFAFP